MAGWWPHDDAPQMGNTCVGRGSAAIDLLAVGEAISTEQQKRTQARLASRTRREGVDRYAHRRDRQARRRRRRQDLQAPPDEEGSAARRVGQGLSPYCSRSLSQEEPSPPEPFFRGRGIHAERVHEIFGGRSHVVGGAPCVICGLLRLLSTLTANRSDRRRRQ